MDIVIYGAQGYALSTYEAIKLLYPDRKVICFMVTEIGYNTITLGGIPVREIEDVTSSFTSKEKDNFEVIVATPENVQLEIAKTLENYGFKNYRCLDSNGWTELMQSFHSELGIFSPLSSNPVGFHNSTIMVYRATSDKDKPLKNPVNIPQYVHYLQVGRDCCNYSMADIVDNVGDNISGKNGNYSELTGLYWMWKNKLDLKEPEESFQYYGFEQYRRVLCLPEEDILRLADNDIDVILPYPLIYDPNIHAHHERYIKPCDWDALEKALNELHPEYMPCFKEILDQRFLFNYNVIFAKKKVLSDYCEWLFPILERVEELSVPKGIERNDRYIGYMGETLETLYFMRNKDRLKLALTGCKLLV